jgi:hypothetical protein
MSGYRRVLPVTSDDLETWTVGLIFGRWLAIGR